MRPQSLIRPLIFLATAVAAACAPLQPTEKPLPLRDFIVFFSAENTVLDPVGQEVIQGVAATAKENTGHRLMIEAEASGDSAHAAFLAQQRVKAVEQALVFQGISESRIDLGASARQTEQVGVIARRVTIRFEAG